MKAATKARHRTSGVEVLEEMFMNTEKEEADCGA